MGANGNRKTTESFGEEVFEKTNGEFSLVGEYLYSTTPTQIKHNKCGKIFTIQPINFLISKAKEKCPYCSTTHCRMKTTEEFKKEVWDAVKDEYSILGEYFGNKVKILIRHNKCNKDFLMKPNHFLSGERCPYCFGGTSKQEESLREWIAQESSIFTKRKRLYGKDGKQYEIDIYIPERNFGFEFNGTYWHSTQRKDKKYHIKKRKACADNNIQVFFLWEHWGENVCKEIIKKILYNENMPFNEYPYSIQKNNFLYLNKDIFLLPQKIPEFEYIGESRIKEEINFKFRNFEIYNSGYFKYQQIK